MTDQPQTFKEPLLTTVQMAQADALAVASGVPSLTLMENAGRGVAEEIAKRHEPQRVRVLVGPGNNGGDGWVIARHLKAAGFEAVVEWLQDPAGLKGDAAEMARRWEGSASLVNPQFFKDELVVDALFGAGLVRPLGGLAADVVACSNKIGACVVAVDVPSGLDGTTGAALGPAFKADLTVTFFRRKPGHVLMPGRALCGELVVRDIGIPETVLEEIAPTTWVNNKNLWQQAFPRPNLGAHKYTRGHTLVVSGGPWATGAARLAARGALRVGAGVVTVAAPTEALPVHAAHLTAIMLAECNDSVGLAALLVDQRKNAVVIGPGNGVGTATRANVAAALGTNAAVVLDADALTSFADEPGALFKLGRDRVVMTPHVGEFARLFPDTHNASPSLGRLEAARAAAGLAHMVVVLKGPDTIIASPDGRAAINENAPPWLATAGAGDVLAGFIGGLMAQGMPAFEAACAGVWLHGAAASQFGPGLIAEDLPEQLPGVLQQIS